MNAKEEEKENPNSNLSLYSVGRWVYLKGWKWLKLDPRI